MSLGFYSSGLDDLAPFFQLGLEMRFERLRRRGRDPDSASLTRRAADETADRETQFLLLFI